MTQLFNVITAHRRALSDMRNGSGGRPRRWTRGVSAAIPIALGIATYWYGWNLAPVAGQLLAGLAIAAGVLIGVFAQVAAWRMRLDERAEARPESEAPNRRAVDAAAYHTLAGTLTAVVASVLAVLLTAGTPGGRVWSAMVAATATYLTFTLLLLVSSLYETYEANVRLEVRDQDRELLRRGR